MPIINLSDISIAPDRMRREFSEENLASLIESLQRPMGLMNPLVVKSADDEGKYELIAGERRFKALSLLYGLEEEISFAAKPLLLGEVPVTISDELTVIDQLKAELDENVVREAFTYIEEAEARAKIARLEQKLIEKEKPETPTARGLMDISPEAMKRAAEKITGGKSGGGYTKQVRDSLEITEAMETKPELAQKLKKAKSFNEGRKILDKAKKEELQHKLAATQGAQFSTDMHDVLHGNCLELMPKLTAASFDVCICDPIYGIDAHKFGQQEGFVDAQRHSYSDTYEQWKEVMPQALKLMSRALKKDAHIYLAFDFRRYEELVTMLKTSGSANNPWQVPTYPIVQYKKDGGHRVPRPGYTFRRTYEMWLYAYRGDKQENTMMLDVIETRNDRTSTHGAHKPVELLKTFLARSANPGDKCLDFMAGSGGIIRACHEQKIRCTAIEIDQTYYGSCLQVIKDLKSL